MCLTSSWKGKKRTFFPFEEYLKLAEEVFPHLDRLVLYGMGEPLVHPKFIDMLKVARKYLPPTATIFFTTNGSLVKPEVTDILLENNLINEIAFSCDTVAPEETEGIGHQSSDSISNLKYMLSHPLRKNIRVGVETVIMRSNFRKIERLIDYLTEFKVDYISISHLYPYYEFLTSELLYTMISKESLEVLNEVEENGWDLILRATQELIGEQMQITTRDHYHTEIEKLPLKAKPAADKFNELMRKARERNVHLNIPLFMYEKHKFPIMKELENIFSIIKEKASKAGIELILPAIYPQFSERSCPYVKEEATVIRSDGEVAPCFKYLYQHNSNLNYHRRMSSAYSFGNVFKQPLKEIWNSERYVKFRERLNDFNNNVPYCPDCGLSTNNCFYASEDESDCYGNEPFCAECPYSVNITRCLI